MKNLIQSSLFNRQVIPICKERPRSPFYMEMSPEISGIYTQLIEGKLNPDEAVVALEAGLEEILEKH